MTSLRNIVFTAALGTLAPLAASAQAVLQINSSLPESSFAHVFLQEYETRLEAAAPGAIDVQIFMSNIRRPSRLRSHPLRRLWRSSCRPA